MGIYLDSKIPFSLYSSETKKPFFVDKSIFLTELFPLVTSGNNHICITRPRRFGKTIMANMISSFFSKGCDSHALFDRLQISEKEHYQKYLNHHHVIHIDFSMMDDSCNCYAEYISTIKDLLREDLRQAYPKILFRKGSPVHEDLMRIFAETGDRFLFVLDEWDAVFHMSFMTEENKKSYLLFLKNLLKDRGYVSLAYMTGILPIAKYSSGSELNMFAEYTMVSEAKFSDSFGFTDTEVDMLYRRFCSFNANPQFTRTELTNW